MISKEKIEGFDKKHDVVGAFVEYDGKILLLHRQDHKPQGNTWAVPGGKVDKGEDLLDALVREVKEEIGLDLDRNGYIFFEKYFLRHPGWDLMYHVYYIQLQELPKIYLNTGEHKDYQWLSPADALKLDLLEDEDSCIKWKYNV